MDEAAFPYPMAIRAMLKLSLRTEEEMSAKASELSACVEMRQKATDRRLGRIGAPSVRDRSSPQIRPHAGPSNANKVIVRTRDAYSSKRGQAGCLRGSLESLKN